MIIANFMATQTDLKQVWMVVSPQNPFKPKASLANNYDRLHLVKLAIGDNELIKSSDIEFGLPVPSYTIDTLTYLKEKYPKKEFALIMGGDNLGTFHKWKNYEKILEGHEIYVYKRPSYDLGDLQNHEKVHLFEAPLLQISATQIRNNLKNGKSIRYLVTDEVFNYLDENPIYSRK
jgi:nicotinate-nucleotide adenylyltransferase